MSNYLFDDNVQINGNVGIGTNNPESKLDVRSAGYLGVAFDGINSTSETQIIFKNNTASRLANQANTEMIFETNSTEKMRIHRDGNVLIGNTSKTIWDCKLEVWQGNILLGAEHRLCWYYNWSIRGHNGSNFYFFYGDNAHTTSGHTAYITPTGDYVKSSDDRLKHNEKTIENSLDIIMKLVPLEYDKTVEFLDENFNGNLDELNIEYEKSVGFIAQDVYKIEQLKYLVSTGDNDKPYSLNYNGIWTYGIKAIQELKVEKDTLENKVFTLETKNTELENKCNNLENKCNNLEEKNNQLENQLQDILARLSNLENN